jgi:hypothetical protein
MSRGQEIRSPEYFGVRLYVGTAPYGRAFIVPAETFAEVCAWFDTMAAKGWQEE